MQKANNFFFLFYCSTLTIIVCLYQKIIVPHCLQFSSLSSQYSGVHLLEEHGRLGIVVERELVRKRFDFLCSWIYEEVSLLRYLRGFIGIVGKESWY